MEDKQLNYNQPFLSVRRFTSTLSSEINEQTKTNNKIPSISSLPYHKSEFKSGPVSNPGTVPFVWEKSPGRPKYENECPALSLEQPLIAPRLPPGRFVKVKEHNLDKVSESSSPTSCDGRRVASGSLSYSSLDEITAKIEATKNKIEENESSDSGDNDEAYQDALDTLSRTESVFLNCSLSGLSGLEEPEVKPSGTFLTDPQTREFMMGRFLPAAKAVAYDSSQSLYKKPAVVAKQQPQQLKDEMGGDNRPPLHCSIPNIIPNYAEVCIDEESGDEDDDFVEPGNLSTRVCGLLPRFCLLSPVPGVSVRTRAPRPPVSSRRQVRSSSATSHQETKNEGTHLSRQEQGSVEQNHRPELCEHNQSPAYNNQNLDGNSLYRRLQGSGISSHENKLPQSRFYKEAEVVAVDNSFNSEKRCADNFKELSGHQGTEKDIGSATPVVEKTLYADSVYKVTFPQKKSVCFDIKEHKDCKKRNVEISKIKGFEATPLVDSINKYVKDPKIMEENGICEEENMKPFELLSANLEAPNNYYMDTGNQQKVINVKTTENSSEMNFQFLIPPPLPKAPSESWLGRTLPSMPLKNSNCRSFLGNKVLSGDLKWETIVKSTKVQQHNHAKNSEELSVPASKT